MMTALDEAQQRLPDAVEKALNGEEAAIKVGTGNRAFGA